MLIIKICLVVLAIALLLASLGFLGHPREVLRFCPDCSHITKQVRVRSYATYTNSPGTIKGWFCPGCGVFEGPNGYRIGTTCIEGVVK